MSGSAEADSSPRCRESLSESYAAIPRSLAPARRAVAAVAIDAGATAEQVDEIRLATSEALTNAILHAYRGSSGDVHLTAAVAGEELWVLVADDGVGLQPDRGRGGLGVGLALIAQLCDELAIVKRSHGGTELRMRFRLGRSRRSELDHQSLGSVASANSPASSIFSTTE
jgi:stage II sporulation protein AB (anti-sigma F factor)